MIPFPNFDPVALRVPPLDLPMIGAVGPLEVRWYGLMYALAFFIGFFVLKDQAKRRNLPLSTSDIQDFLTYLFMGVFLGGRLGYVLFYNLPHYMANPLEILAVWHGGMAFHGGLLGSIFAGWLYCHRKGLRFWDMADATIVAIPIGLGLGRFGNFINGELWGRVTDVPWAMVFPAAGPEPRHPSQLYELGLEGIGLFAVLWLLSRRGVPAGTLLGIFLAGYGLIRFSLEFFRNPDSHLGFVAMGLSMGQLLSLPMVLAGIAMVVWAHRRRGEAATVQPQA